VIDLGFIQYTVEKIFPGLKRELKIAHIKDRPSQFVRKTFISSLYLSIACVVLFFFALSRAGTNMLYLLILFPAIFLISFWFMMQSPKVTIRKRGKQIDKEVLFAGRYLLVKLESGTPLFNSLIDASKSYGISAKYFKEIVDEILTGKPIEKALDEAYEYNASEKFKIILAELSTSLKTGVDVGTSLKSIIEHITQQQLIEIKEYGKKLNAYMMLYMIIAIVVPSLGMTMLVVIAAFLSLELSLVFIIIATSGLVFIQLMFLSLFRSIRPAVNL